VTGGSGERRVFGGKIAEASRRRLVFSPRRRMAYGWLMGGAAAGAAGFFFLVLSSAGAPLPSWALGPLCLLLAPWLWAWSHVHFVAYEWSRLRSVHRRLVVERVDGGAMGGTGTVAVEVDGATLGPSRRRGLYWLSISYVTTYVLVIHDRTLTIASLFGKEVAISPRVEAARATAAIVHAERESSTPYASNSIVPLVHGLVDVMDLTPERTGGPRGCSLMGLSIAKNAAMFVLIGWHVWILYWLSTRPDWIASVAPGVVGGVALATLVPDAVAYLALCRGYIRRFDGVAESLVADTPP
jgi:hypothetical protein